MDPDTQVMEMETVFQLIHKLHQLTIHAKVDINLMDSGAAYLKQLRQHVPMDIL